MKRQIKFFAGKYEVMGMGENDPNFKAIGNELILANQEWDYVVMIDTSIKKHLSAQEQSK